MTGEATAGRTHREKGLRRDSIYRADPGTAQDMPRITEN